VPYWLSECLGVFLLGKKWLPAGALLLAGTWQGSGKLRELQGSLAS